MIAIVNIGAVDGADEAGMHRYSVRINQREICQYEHMRSRGLAACLTRASMAVQAADAEQIVRLMQEADRG